VWIGDNYVKKKIAKTNFLKGIKDTIRHYDMITKGDRVLVAVSGGADSVCLLKALLDIAKGAGIAVVAANLDHGLRGRESAAESRFVEDLTKGLGVTCVRGKIRTGIQKKKKISVEEYLRAQRYAFLIRSAKKKRCNVVATGHTMDDQAETILMRIIKGASSEGMGGIPPVRREGPFTFIRPLIRSSRKEILMFLDASGLPHVEDSSNSDTKFLRNRLRHEIFPVVEKINPKIKRSLVNMADSIREDMCLVDKTKKNAVKNITVSYSPEKGVRISDLLIHPKSLRKEMFKELFINAGGDVKKLTFRHWMNMDDLIRLGDNGKSLDLPGKVMVTKRKKAIIFSKRPG
jgi:tRNA(Ile)-lysidine synthase